MDYKFEERPTLSKGTLGMKFMQRNKAEVKPENSVAEGREMCSAEITERMSKGYSNFIIEPSFARCENLIEGRLSFRGMNPEIERLLELEQEEKRAAERQQQSNDVSDQATAKFYYANNEQASAAPAMEQKFSKFKKVNSQGPLKRLQEGGEKYTGGGEEKRTKFMKPKDSDNDDEDDDDD